MSDRRKQREARELARKRVAIMVAVRGGKLSVEEAARQLGISRKTYYEWEQKALSAMTEAMENRPAGRPSTKPHPQVVALQQRVRELEDELIMLRETQQARELLPWLLPHRDKKKGSPKKKG
jgi:transposase